MMNGLLLRLLPLCLVPALAHAQAGAPIPPQDPAPLVAQARALLEARAAGIPGQMEAEITPPRLAGQPACADPRAFLAGTGVLQPRTTIGVRCLSPQPWTVYLQAGVRIEGDYFVLRHPVERGQALAAEDLEPRHGDLLQDRRRLTDPARLIGWIAERPLRAGETPDPGALRDPDSIARGTRVRTEIQGEGFSVSGAGLALESGEPGARIKLRTDGGRIISGVVIDAHSVRVMM